jgi:Zn-dependent protease
VSETRQDSAGSPSQDGAVSSTFLAMVAAFVFCAVLMVLQPAAARVLAFPFVLIGYLISLCLHEFGHAIVAYHCGDRTVRAKGYLTLNPLRYTDVQYSIVLPILFMVIGGIGLPGGAVYINRQLLLRRVYGALVSAGGPLATAVVLGLLLAVLQAGWQTLAAAPVLEASLAFLALLELTALMFNLLPCPGLDGWGIIEPFLPSTIRAQGHRLAYIAPTILVLVLFFVPPLNAMFWDTIFQAAALVGLDPRLAFGGLRIFQFWRG